ncbi:lysophospholipase L1-like esterase [Paraburkholderia sp. EB58]|uniref:SGNH/GDSL hydrolase family protein n=1 Tax=Paraburkholderia sp. EB58 TaxID=3035125 RepID=UPI003D1ADE23
MASSLPPVTPSVIQQAATPTYQGFTPLAFPRWRKAMGGVRSGTARARLCCLGDSTTFGLGSVGTPASYSNAKAFGYPTQLAQALGAQKNLAAHWDSFWCDNGLDSVAGATLPLADPRIALGTGWSNTGQTSMGGLSLFNNTTTNPVSFTPINAFDTFDIWTVCNSGLGTVTADIGGAVLATISTSTGTHGATKTTVSTGAAPATGTINVRLSGTLASVFLIGIEAYNSTLPKVSVWNQGWCGGTTANITGNASPWSTLPALVAAAPNLVMCGIGINDSRTGVTLAQYIANYQELITAITAVSDMVLFVENPPEISVVTTALWTQFQQAVYQLAAANNLPLIDLTQRWVSWAYSNALGYYYDALHPYAAGYGDITQAFLDAPLLF